MRSSSPLKTAATTGSLWRSERIHLMDISREPDNRSDHSWLYKKDDSGIHKFLPPLRCYSDSNNLPAVDCSNESDISEALFPPAKLVFNDGSDFSDTSAACSTSTAPLQYNRANPFPDRICYECATSQPLACTTPIRRRRRRVVSRSLVLDNSKIDHYMKLPPSKMNSGLSDSGVLLRGDHGHNSDSSSSSSSIIPVKLTRKKPKSNRRSLPPGYCYIGYGNKPLPPGPVYGNYYSPSWVPLHSEDINNLQKVQELESEKKNLILQASVLADQVEAQADKISELERLLGQKKEDLIQLEHNLHQEVLTRSAVENSKLELMTELSSLRLRLTAAERDRKESDDKCRKLDSEIITIKSRLIELETEHTILKGRLSRNGTHIISSHDSYDYEKLKSVLDSVTVSNDEKDHKLDDLRSSLTKYKKLQDIVLSGHNRKVADISSHEGLSSDSLLFSPSNDSFNKQISEVNHLSASRYSTLPSTSSIPKQFNQSIQSCVLNSGHSSYISSASTAFQKSNSMENICPSATGISSNSQYGTLPRQANPQVLQQQLDTNELFPRSTEKEKPDIPRDISLKLSNKSKRNQIGSGKSSGVSFGKGFFKLRYGKRSSSEPYLAPDECSTIPSTEKENADYNAPLTPQPYLIKAEKDRNKGFFKLFSKWKKSGSQNIDKIESDFKRGGIRATAGPRLGWSRDLQQETDIPFCRWNTDMIVDWMNSLGLSMYISECRRWMCNGDLLSKTSECDVEKELSIKNPLHKKKVMLAIKSMTSKLPNLPASINELDYHWVVRWLDDVGLPQYKDAFADSRVDGRVLHCLTVDDLLFLKVTSQLHHISIRRGIQLLREKGFDPHCVVRRSLPDETNKTYTPELVALWSNHRVMEWLRTVDLSEYAPNLRGSGVHGALIVYEPKFNTNLFATLLNIPPTKTLLRRHLATHFKHIVGDELTQLKRERETETPLSPSIKLKTVRKPQFALKKKRNKSEFENEDYICPMDIPVLLDVPKHYTDCDKLVVRRNSDPSPQEQKHIEIQEETVEKIETVSKEISSLTTMLKDENLNEAPSTVV